MNIIGPLTTKIFLGIDGFTLYEMYAGGEESPISTLFGKALACAALDLPT
jgi:hypothetical protein